MHVRPLLREVAILARHGDEEFIAILPNTGRDRVCLPSAVAPEIAT